MFRNICKRKRERTQDTRIVMRTIQYKASGDKGKRESEQNSVIVLLPVIVLQQSFLERDDKSCFQHLTSTPTPPAIIYTPSINIHPTIHPSTIIIITAVLNHDISPSRHHCSLLVNRLPRHNSHSSNTTNTSHEA